MHTFSKFGECGSKIEPAMPILILNFRWVWQTQFLTYTHETLEKYVFFVYHQMILVPFFDIPNQKSIIKKILIFWLHDIGIILLKLYQGGPIREQKIQSFSNYRFLVRNIKKWY